MSTLQYICQQASDRAPTTTAFKERDLKNMTQTKISNAFFEANPTEKQIAHAGYAANICAFLYSTAEKKKITCGINAYPIKDSYLPAFPLQPPRFICKINESQRKATPAQLEKIEAFGAPFGMKKVQFGKEGHTYTVTSPTWELFFRLASICHPRGPVVEGYGQMVAVGDIFKVYQCIDLFLATNTYYAKRAGPADYGLDQMERTDWAKSSEWRVGAGFWYREGEDADTWKAVEDRKRRKTGKDAPKREDAMEPYDLTSHKKGYVQADDIVVVAKPSPHPSSVNYGTPLSTPNAPGLCFPYFQGMLIPDAQGLRSLIGDLFFYNLPKGNETPAKAYVRIRDSLGLVASTKEGLCLAHILKGVEMALKSQSRLFLMFDKKEYLGFNLLGDLYTINKNGGVLVPSSASQLRTDLGSLVTHEGAMEKLKEKLATMTDASGDTIVVEEGEMTCSKLADILGKLTFGEDEEDAEMEISSLLKAISFTKDYKTFSPANIAEAVGFLLNDEPLPADIKFYIPNLGWSGVDKKAYKVLATFGPQSFSFITAQGQSISIPSRSIDKDPFEIKDGKAVGEYRKFIVAEKPIRQCVNDWVSVLKSGTVSMKLGERAAGSRGHVFLAPVYGPIWDKLKEGAATGVFKKRVPEVAAEAPVLSFEFGTGSFDAF